MPKHKHRKATPASKNYEYPSFQAGTYFLMGGHDLEVGFLFSFP